MRRISLKASLMIALALSGAAPGVFAQSAATRDKTVLPVFNNASGKLEAYLVLEPTDATQASARWRFGANRLDAVYGLESGDSLALLCDRKSGLASAMSNLAGSCVLGALGDDNGSRRSTTGVDLSRGDNKFGVRVGDGRDNLPAWLTPNATTNKVDITDLTVSAQRTLPREGYVSIAGTVAKAKLLSPEAAAASGLPTDRWNTKSFTVGGGFGNFGASIVGHVIDTPGQPKWVGLGLGVTWRTPWSGQLSVGADNVVTRGKNPFAPPNAADQDEGTVPYVKYEQDL